MADMSPEERATMLEHIAYWAPHLKNGTMIVMGPVMDPNGGWGLGVIGVTSEEEVDELIEHDPANGLNRYEVLPMRAKTREI